MPSLAVALAGGSSIRPLRSSESLRIATVFMTLPPIRYSVRSPPMLAAMTTSQCDFQCVTEPLDSDWTRPL